MAATAKKANEDLNLNGKTLVVGGGSGGIGAATAVRMAELGASRIILVARGKAATEQVIERIKAASVTTRPLSAIFVQADLGTIKGIRDAVRQVEKIVGQKGIDYVLATQGRTPNGLYKEQEDGLDSQFAVQTVSRFAFAYLFSSRGLMADGGAFMSVISPGSNVSQLDFDDLSLKKQAARQYRLTFMVSMMQRDSVVCDAYIEELAAAYPSIRYYHVFPGAVKSELLTKSDLPFPMNYLFSAFTRFLGAASSDYCEIPIFLLANPTSQEQSKARRFDNNIKEVKAGAFVHSEENRKQIFDALKKLVGH